MTQIPAGWFPDPAPPTPGQAPLLRYWDGQQWTEHLHPSAPEARTPAPYAGPTTPDGAPLSGWWRRVAAQIIDGIAIGIVASVVTLPLQISVQDRMQRVLDRYQRSIDASNGATPDLKAFLHDYLDAAGPVFVWSLLISFAVFVVYEGGFLRWKGATPGKMALGIGVRLRDQPGRLPWSSIVPRLLVKQGYTLVAVIALLQSGVLFVLVAYAALLLFSLIDQSWPLWDSKRQAIHEKLARTNVVRKQ